MADKKTKLIFNIPDIWNKFDYIKDALLKKQLGLSFNYMFFLIWLELKYDLDSGIIYRLFKDVIINTASTIESILFYTLNEISKKWSTKEKNILNKKAIRKHKYRDEKKIYDLDKMESIFRGIKTISREWIHDKIQFNDLIPCWKDVWIYDDDLAKKLDEIRDKRNQIHLHTLKEDKVYTKKDINDIFEITRKFIEKIKSKLNSL